MRCDENFHIHRGLETTALVLVLVLNSVALFFVCYWSFTLSLGVVHEAYRIKHVIIYLYFFLLSVKTQCHYLLLFLLHSYFLQLTVGVGSLSLGLIDWS